MFQGRVPRRRLFVTLTAALMFAGLVVLPVHAATSDTYETRVTQNHQLFRSGEPEIAVDPTNPANMVYVATKFKVRTVPYAGVEVPNVALQFTEEVWGDQMQCALSVSHDYGQTWSQGLFPYQPWPACSDPMAAAGPDGTLYVANDATGNPFQANDPGFESSTVSVSRSTDDGRTWSVPISTGAPVDRPMFRVDQKTGYLWENSGFNEGCGSGMPCGRELTYSRDKGNTWVRVNHPLNSGVVDTLPPPGPGGVYAPGSAPFPGSGHFAVYDNILATVDAPTAATAAQPAQPAQFCVLSLSPTDPTTGTYHCTEIPGTTGMTGDTGISGPLISADPTKTGRFAIALKPGDEESFKVFVTANAGADNPTWSGPTTVDAPYSADPPSTAPDLLSTVGAGKPWFDYSQSATGPSGLLGIMWKGRNPTTGLLDVYSTISTDNGGTFSQPKKVNSVSFRREPSTDGPGDDLSFIAFGTGANGKPNAYIGWGDTRDGTVGTTPSKVEGWFARVPVVKF